MFSSRSEQYEVKDIDSGLLRQRRNLLFVSISLLVYYLGNAEILSIPTFFGAVKLNNHGILIPGFWLVFAYSLWRYWLYRESAVNAFEVDLLNAYRNNKMFNNLVKRVALKESVGQKNLNPIIVYGVFTRKLDFSKSIERKKSGALSREKLIFFFENYPKISLPWLTFLPIEVVCKFTAMASGRSFSDYMLPYLISLLTLTVGLLHAKNIYT